MADTAASILAPAVTDAAKRVGATIKRQFYYLCCFTTIITSLEYEAENLQATTQDLQEKVDRARNDLRVITSIAETWLKHSKDMKDETDGVLNEVETVKSGYSKFGARFGLSRRAKKITDSLKELRGQCPVDDNVISHPQPPASMVAVPTGTTYEFESRKQIEDDIMTTLVGGDVNMMGICGMGGLGKTTMAKKIMNKALENKVFDVVVMTVVSQPPVNKLKIQVDVGVSLGLSHLKDETSETRAAQALYARLSDSKRTLLVLDDVWEKLVLEDLGIPCNHKGCTILLTSRNGDVLRSMKVTKVFRMKVLSEEEAWFLFKETSGTCVDDTELNSIAKEVVNECKGLPIALTTVGAALREEMDGCVWKDRRRQLKNCDPSIPGVLTDVYNPLRLSYEALDSNHQSVFLLCCLYPEDANIPLEDLTLFCMGLGIFGEGIKTLEDARNNMHSLTSMLKSRHLLLHSEQGDYHVRMHDVVRDVCIFIAKQKKCIGGNDCTWISSSHPSELPTTLAAFPNLRLFLKIYWEDREFKLDNNFLEGINDLSVLFIERLSLIKSLPRTTYSLKNLNTLVLKSCIELQTLCGVGELVNLEILICHGCNSIEELPPEMKKLNRLKLLDVTDCSNLQRIGRGIISSLVGLEELKMRGSFNKWEAEDREERENAGLRELEALTNLRWLEIYIQDRALVGESFHFSSKLDRFHITFSDFCTSNYTIDELYHSFQSNKKLGLRMEKEIKLGPWIEVQLLPDTKCLSLRGNGANKVDLAKIQNIRLLDLGYSNTWARTSMDRLSNIKHLKELHLNDLPALKHFGNDSLPQLEVLTIRNCKKMEQVFLWTGESQNSHPITKIFPKLNNVQLFNLPNLNTFYQGIEGIEFPLLRILDIRNCKKIRSMVSKGVQSNENNIGGSNYPQIQDVSCQQLKVSFGCLEDLTTDWNPFRNHKVDISFFNGLKEFKIRGYEGNASFITSSIAKNLVNLAKLTIEECDEMTQVITNEEKKGMSGVQNTLLQFPKLQELILRCSRKLVSICEWKCDVELPSLRKVKIYYCPNMKNLTMGSINAPILEYFETDMDNYLHLQVPFNTMKKLTIRMSKYPLNCDKIDASHFNGLGELTISAYTGSMSFFPSSITGSLLNLISLTIENCFEMVKVIEDDEEKDNVGSIGKPTSLFPKLQKLRLIGLSKLVSFCEWKYDVELPSLSELSTLLCPNMKSFTLGRLATPILQIARLEKYIGVHNFYHVQDLNDLVWQVYEERNRRRIMDSSEEEIVEEQKEEKGDGEGQERMDEQN